MEKGDRVRLPFFGEGLGILQLFGERADSHWKFFANFREKVGEDPY